MKTINKLFKKEWHLSLKSAVFIYIYALLSLTLIAPNYPYCTAFMYSLIGVAVLFSMFKGNKDIEFSAILPIKRVDIVKGKFISLLFIEILQIICAIPFALISALLINTGGNIVGVDANLTLFAFTLIEFSVFNLIFMPIFFKTGYKVGWATFFGLVGFFLVTIVLELLLALVPAIHLYLDGFSYLGYQALFLCCAILVFIFATWLSYKLSTKNFEKVNL